MAGTYRLQALEFDQPPGMLKVFVECELPLEVVERRSHEAICKRAGVNTPSSTHSMSQIFNGNTI